MHREHIIEADLTWVNDAFEPNVQVAVDTNGLIEQVGFLDLQPTLRLAGRALLPGMVNAHSHAFQRGLRGFGEQFSSTEGNLQNWHEALEELVECLEAEEFKNLCRMAFEEMLHHGITTVGEFHYFHHDRSQRGYGFDDLVLQAAKDTGIRLVLLCCYCGSGGAGQPLSSAQRRFGTGGVDQFCAHVDRLRQHVDGSRQQIGVSTHSICGATPDEITALAGYARRHNLIMHIHVEESPGEIEDGGEAYGTPLVELLLDQDLLSPEMTLVHCTGASPEQLRAIAGRGAKVCLCPTTEASRGSEIADLPVLVEAGACLCLGTDSNVRISMNEEMRWLEYVQRAFRQRRGVCVDAQGRTATALWRCATVSGAEALGLAAGRIATGCSADLIAVDTQGLSLLGATRESLLTAFVFGAGRACVTHVCVGGQWHIWHD